MSRARGLRPSGSLVVAALVAVGCAPSFDGERRADGEFRALSTFEAVGQPFGAALRRDDPQTLVVSALTSARRCSVGGVSSYIATEVRGDRAVLATWTRDEGGCGVLTFVDHDCRALTELMQCVDAPVDVTAEILGGALRDHLLVHLGDGAFWAVEPWSGDWRHLGSDVAAWRWAGSTRLWLLDGGTLVLHDPAAEERREIATDVAGVAFAKDGAAIYSADGLWRIDADDAAPALLAEGGCEPRVAPNGSELLYLAPCADRVLRWRDLETGDDRLIATDVGAFRADTWPPFFLGGSGELLSWTGDAVSFVAESASLDSVRRVTQGATSAHLFSRGTTLFSYDGEESLPVLDGLASFDVRHGHLAALVDADLDGVGRLVLRSEAVPVAETLAVGVPVDGYGFAAQVEGLAYLSGVRDGRGVLELTSLTTDHHFVIDSEVTEVAEVLSDVAPGIVYLVDDGSRSGIWFAQRD